MDIMTLEQAKEYVIKNIMPMWLDKEEWMSANEDDKNELILAQAHEVMNTVNSSISSTLEKFKKSL